MQPEQPPVYSGYPRDKQVRDRASTRISISLVDEARKLLIADLGMWCVIGFLTVTFMSILDTVPRLILDLTLLKGYESPSALWDGNKALFGVTVLVNLITSAIGTIGFCGVSMVALRKLESGRLDFSAYFEPFSRFAPIALITLVSSSFSLVAAGLILVPEALPLAIILLVAGIIFQSFFSLAPIIVVEQNVGAGLAMRMSFDAVKNQMIPLLGLIIASGIVAMLGLCFCIIGIVVTFQIPYIAFGILYHRMFPRDTAGISSQPPPTSLAIT